MPQGMQIWNEDGEITLDTRDYTFTKIAELIIPGLLQGWTNGNQTEQYVVSIPGYDPETCFILISPTSYLAGEQVGYDVGGFLPYYRDLGGESVAFIRYSLIRRGNDLTLAYRYATQDAIAEVFKVL